MEHEKVDPTPPVRKPEEIERDMAHTREAITEKVVALENQVLGTVKTAADTITDTVEKVKSLVTEGPGAITDTVKNSVAAVTDVVKEQFDVSRKIRENPWASVLGATAAGFVTGLLVGGRRSESTVPTATNQVPFTPPQSYTPAAAPREPGILDNLWAKVRTELQQLAEETFNTATASLRDNIHTQVPNLVKNTIEAGTGGLHNRIQDRHLM